MSPSLFQYINPRYLSGLADNPKQVLQPIAGYAHKPLLSPEEACEPILLYIMEWDTAADEPPGGLYAHLNRTLKQVDRLKLRPWFRYMKLFITALAKLPANSHQTVWRGVRKDHSADYPPGAEVTWWAFLSCTASLNVLESELYLGNVGTRTLFSIETINARTIHSHSHFTAEDEILLLPGTFLEVKSRLNPAPDLYLIHLVHKVPPHVLLEPPFEGTV